MLLERVVPLSDQLAADLRTKAMLLIWPRLARVLWFFIGSRPSYPIIRLENGHHQIQRLKKSTEFGAAEQLDAEQAAAE